MKDPSRLIFTAKSLHFFTEFQDQDPHCRYVLNTRRDLIAEGESNTSCTCDHGQSSRKASRGGHQPLDGTPSPASHNQSIIREKTVT